MFLYGFLGFSNEKNFNLKVEKISYGRTQAGLPLEAIKILAVSTTPKKAVLMTGGVHGNEYMGLINKLVDQITENELEEGYREYFESGGVLYAISKVNPEGVVRGQRFLSNGEDLNRLFFFKEEELLEEKKVVDERDQLVAFMDRELHESHMNLLFAMDYHCCAGGVLLPLNYRDLHYEAYLKLDQLLKDSIHPQYFSKTTKEVFGSYFPGTLKDYWNKRYKAISITYEGIDPSEEIRKASHHYQFWNKFLRYISQNDDLIRNIHIANKDDNTPSSNSLESKSYHSE